MSMDLNVISIKFTDCLIDDGSISIQSYVEGYKEICEFLSLLGSVFGFVLNDVKSKMEILEQRMRELSPHYSSIQSMMAYETENDIIDGKSSLPSGCRTLLRLHRALFFIIDLFRALAKMPLEDKLTDETWRVYQETLQKHHAWIVRKSFGAAVCFLPRKSSLMDSFRPLQPQDVEESLIKAANSMEKICSLTETLYISNNMTELK